jgi:hypothetical protein
MAQGCEPTGPVRAWIRAANRREADEIGTLAEDDASIALELSRPLDPTVDPTPRETGASAARGLLP